MTRRLQLGYKVACCPPGPRYLTQGDSLARPDGAVPAGQTVGKVTAVARAGTCWNLERRHWRALGRLIAGLQRLRLGLRGEWGVRHGYRIESSTSREEATG